MQVSLIGFVLHLISLILRMVFLCSPVSLKPLTVMSILRRMSCAFISDQFEETAPYTFSDCVLSLAVIQKLAKNNSFESDTEVCEHTYT